MSQLGHKQTEQPAGRRVRANPSAVPLAALSRCPPLLGAGDAGQHYFRGYSPASCPSSVAGRSILCFILCTTDLPFHGFSLE